MPVTISVSWYDGVHCDLIYPETPLHNLHSYRGLSLSIYELHYIVELSKVQFRK
jgi:hypothetical protein